MSLSRYQTSAAQVKCSGGAFRRKAGGRTIPMLGANFEVLTDPIKFAFKITLRPVGHTNMQKRTPSRRHPRHLTIHFKFKAIADRRQWASAASNSRRYRLLKLCLAF